MNTGVHSPTTVTAPDAFLAALNALDGSAAAVGAFGFRPGEHVRTPRGFGRVAGVGPADGRLYFAVSHQMSASPTSAAHSPSVSTNTAASRGSVAPSNVLRGQPQRPRDGREADNNKTTDTDNDDTTLLMCWHFEKRKQFKGGGFRPLQAHLLASPTAPLTPTSATVHLDVSEKVQTLFGFRSGEAVRTPSGPATVVGVDAGGRSYFSLHDSGPRRGLSSSSTRPGTFSREVSCESFFVVDAGGDSADTSPEGKAPVPVSMPEPSGGGLQCVVCWEDYCAVRGVGEADFWPLDAHHAADSGALVYLDRRAGASSLRPPSLRPGDAVRTPSGHATVVGVDPDGNAYMSPQGTLDDSVVSWEACGSADYGAGASAASAESADDDAMGAMAAGIRPLKEYVTWQQETVLLDGHPDATRSVSGGLCPGDALRTPFGFATAVGADWKGHLYVSCVQAAVDTRSGACTTTVAPVVRPCDPLSDAYGDQTPLFRTMPPGHHPLLLKAFRTAPTPNAASSGSPALVEGSALVVLDVHEAAVPADVGDNDASVIAPAPATAPALRPGDCVRTPLGFATIQGVDGRGQVFVSAFTGTEIRSCSCHVDGDVVGENRGVVLVRPWGPSPPLPSNHASAGTSAPSSPVSRGSACFPSPTTLRGSAGGRGFNLLLDPPRVIDPSTLQSFTGASSGARGGGRRRKDAAVLLEVHPDAAQGRFFGVRPGQDYLRTPRGFAKVCGVDGRGLLYVTVFGEARVRPLDDCLRRSSDALHLMLHHPVAAALAAATGGNAGHDVPSQQRPTQPLEAIAGSGRSGAAWRVVTDPSFLREYFCTTSARRGPVLLDTHPSATAPLGFRPGEVLTTPSGPGTVLGVDFEGTLYCALATWEHGARDRARYVRDAAGIDTDDVSPRDDTADDDAAAVTASGPSRCWCTCCCWPEYQTRRDFAILSSRDPPDEFLCPILLQVMENPFTATDRHHYEHEAIVHWIASNPLSPFTRQTMTVGSLSRNDALRRKIELWRTYWVDVDARQQ